MPRAFDPSHLHHSRASLRRAIRHGVLLALLAAAAPASAEIDTYTFDPVHTRVMFAISHAGFSNALGTVSGTTGALAFDPDDLSTASVTVRVPVTRIDLGDDKWNAAALAGNLLDGDGYPDATFKSTRVEPIDATHAVVHGTMTLHGVSQDIEMRVTFNQLKRHPLPPFRRTAGFSASATISRKAFGITAWQSVIGDSVELRIEAEATRSDVVDTPDAPVMQAPTTTSAETRPAPPAVTPADDPTPGVDHAPTPPTDAPAADAGRTP